MPLNPTVKISDLDQCLSTIKFRLKRVRSSYSPTKLKIAGFFSINVHGAQSIIKCRFCLCFSSKTFLANQSKISGFECFKDIAATGKKMYTDLDLVLK
jgi:hypothetical protein